MMVRERIGTEAPNSAPYYCPWCHEQRSDSPREHTWDHQDVAPYSHLVHEEFWPVGLASHCIVEGVYP